jgi:predicted RNase H-like HicB family nuclease
MKVTIIIHDAEEGGFWAKAPALPGCATRGHLMFNHREAIDGCLSVPQ